MTREDDRDDRASVPRTAAVLTAGALAAGSAVAIVLAGLLGGCVLSLEPVIAESVFEPALLGTWGSGDDTVAITRDTVAITRAGETGYRIVFSDAHVPSVFHGTAGRVGGRLVLEVVPSSPAEGNDAYRGLLLPGHILFVVDVEPGGLRTHQLKADSLRALLGRGSRWTPHLANVSAAGGHGDHVVLTGTSAELRQWFADNMDRQDIWERVDWRRVPGR